MSGWRFGSVLELFGNSVDRNPGAVFHDRLVEEVLHHVTVFAGIFVVLANDLGGAEALHAKEELAGQARLAQAQHDARPAVAGELAHELGHHLMAYALAAT